MSSSPTTPRAEDRADRPGVHAERDAGSGADGASAWSQPWSQVARPQLLVALGLIALFGALRAWALFPSWFYGDDFTLIEQGKQRLTLDYLFEPHSIHLMPTGRFLAWFVAHNGGLEWSLVASLTLALQVLVALACLWMLITLFGERWATVGLLALYLTSTLSLPATMWWAAAINQLPHQLALCLAVGAWVRYARTRRLLWLLLTFLAVAFGLLSYVKSTLILVVLAYLLLAYFVTGGPVQRVKQAVRRYWPALVGAVILGGGFVITYLALVPRVSAGDQSVDVSDLFDSMVVETLGSGIAGGPWRWSPMNPPVALVDPPLWALMIAWVLLAAFAGWCWLNRSRSLRAWGLLGLYAAASFVLLFLSRATGLSELIGLEPRYSTDLALVFPLCLGLACLELLDAPESGRRRDVSLLTARVPARTPLVLVTVISMLGIWSAVQYVGFWHHDNPARAFADNLTEQVEAGDDLADSAVDPYIFSYDLKLRTLTEELGLDAEFPEISNRLYTVDGDGNIAEPLIDPIAAGEIDSDKECGLPVTSSRTETIELDNPTGDWVWWARLGLLASQDGRVSVTIGDTTREAVVSAGVSSLFVHFTGEVDKVRISVQDPDNTLCVGDLQVGDVIPGELR